MSVREEKLPDRVCVCYVSRVCISWKYVMSGILVIAPPKQFFESVPQERLPRDISKRVSQERLPMYISKKKLQEMFPRVFVTRDYQERFPREPSIRDPRVSALVFRVGT